MYQVVTPATSTVLLTTAEALERLGKTASETQVVERLCQRASSSVARWLGYEPAYQQVQQRFDAEPGSGHGTTLDLWGRPFVSLVSIGAPGEDPLVEDEDFAIRRTGRYGGEAYLYAERGWDRFHLTNGPDWVAVYWCGWWLPTMAGVKPAEVPELPDDIQEAAWLTVLERYNADARDPGARSIRKGSTAVEFRDRSLVRGSVHYLSPEAEGLLRPYKPVSF